MTGSLNEPEWISAAELDAIPGVEIGDPALDREPLVSVLMITRDQDPYLAQAIESVLAQRAAFGYEVIIGEDGSQDRTREICERYRRENPERVRLVVSDRSVGMHRNLARVWRRARGRYIAICEGDDYWTDPAKIAKQAAWMEARPGYTLCGAFTDKIRLRDNGTWQHCGSVRPTVLKDTYGIEDLIPSYGFHTSSVMIRKDAIRFPRWLWNVYCADRPLYLLCAAAGAVGLLAETMSVYRLHGEGVWAPIPYLEKASKGMELFEVLDSHFGHAYHRLIEDTLGNILWSYSAEALEAGEYRVARRLFWLALGRRVGSRKWPPMRTSLGMLLRLYAPSAYEAMRKSGLFAT